MCLENMNEIEIQSDQIILREQAFDGLDMSEYVINHDERESYQLNFNTGGPVALDSLIEVKRDDTGSLQAVVLNVSPSGGQSKIEKTGGDGSDSSRNQESDSLDQIMDNLQKAKTKNKPLPSRDELPPIPSRSQFPNKTRSQFYNRLVDDKNSQPAIMRRIIYAAGELTGQELLRQMNKQGYEDSGSHNACLTILEKETGEIKRHGQGNDAHIEWVGGK